MFDIFLLIKLFISLTELKNIDQKHLIIEHVFLYSLSYFFSLIELKTYANLKYLK